MAKNKTKEQSVKLENDKVRIVIVGHVDHGKSTLIGRLLYDTDSLPDGKMEELKKASEKRGEVIEWSYLLDAFQAERDQAITIDTTQIQFSTDEKNFVIIDAPGHTEFLKNMISGAAQADAAILVVDAVEGLQEQTRRHAYLLSLLGLRQVAVVVNKIDKIDFSAEKYGALCKKIVDFLGGMNIRPSEILPISARHGHNMTVLSDKEMPWYDGKTLIQLLNDLEPRRPSIARPLRFPVQDVYRLEEKRIIVGRIESGILRKGDTLLFSPTNEKAKVTAIEEWPNPDIETVEAHAGQSIGITLDKPIFVERGHVASHEENAPMLSNVFRTHLFWLSKNPMKVGDTFKARLHAAEYNATIQSIDHLIDTETLAELEDSERVEKNQIAKVTIRVRDMVALDPYSDNDKTGRIVLYDEHSVVGGGTIFMDGYADQRRTLTPKSENIYKVDHLLSYDRRAERNGYYGGIFWFTGLSGSGKSTLAMKVEQAMFKKGYHTYVLDGDNVRHGLNKDLGFSPDDRSENIRRISEVAGLISDAGTICITAFISPYRSDRKRARDIKPERFHEIYIKASLDACEDRDPKGLYKKARKGEIKQFTGIDSPYETPENPDLVVDTEANDIDTCIAQIVNYIESNIAVKKNDNDAQNENGEKALAI